MDIYNSRFARLFALNGSRDWAITLGQVTFYSTPREQVTPAWRRHEDRHKQQWRRYWYIGFAILYLWYRVLYGYHNHPLEIEARAAETETD